MAFDLTGKAVKHLRLPTVDYSSTVLKLIPAQSGDVNSRFFRVTLYDDRGDIPLHNYSKVTLFAKLPDGTTEKLDGELDEQRESAICQLAGSMLSMSGRVYCDICLYGNDKNGVGTTLTSQTFLVIVSTSLTDGNATDGSGEMDITITPTKGIDYFTEEDISEMINEVLARLPYYDGSVSIE